MRQDHSAVGAFVSRALLTAALMLPAVPAFAQRIPFERTLEAGTTKTLDVSTDRGKVDVVAGPAGQIVVQGAATVRVGWNVPANAEQLARDVAAHPPMEVAGDTLRLHEPADSEARRAVTVSYTIRVPPDLAVHVVSDSGEITVKGMSGSASVRTQSSTIGVESLAGAVDLRSGSGAISAERVSGPLTVNTASSSFNGRELGGSLTVRTQSGQIDAAFTGPGDVDVETGSSAIRVHGVQGGLLAKTHSGSITAAGQARRDWTITTSSSAVDVDVANAGLTLDAASRSGSVTVTGASVEGTVAEHAVKGAVGGGGPLLHISTGSGAIRVRVGGLP